MPPDLRIPIIPALSSALGYRFAEAWPAWYLAAGGLLLLAYLVYKHESGTALPRHKIFLGILRAAALLLILAMIFRPVRVSERSHIKDSVLAIAIDTSLSMEMRDKYRDKAYEAALAAAAGIAPPGAKELTPDQQAQLELLSRAQLVAKILDQSGAGLLREIEEKCTPRLFTFSSDITPRQWPQEGRSYEATLKPEGRTTAIGDCIRKITRELKGQRVAGLVIVTDGQSNVGREPVAAAEEYALSREEPFPIFTVGVGDPSEPKDIEVLQIFGNNTVFARDYVLFTVAVSGAGFRGRRVGLAILSGEKILASTTIELTGESLQQIPVRFKIGTAGKYECRARIEPEPGEITARNNESPPHLLEVIDRPVQVLVVADKPTWEYRYLKNYLIRDASVKVSLLLQSADPDFFQEGTRPIGEFPKTREELFEYDVVILLGANAAGLTNTDLHNLQVFVETVGGGLLVAASESCPPSMYTNTPVEKVLPVVPGPPLYYDPLRERPVLVQSFTPLLTASGRTHPITTFASSEKENMRVWDNLPELFYYFPAQKLKPGAAALLEHPTDGSENAHYPLVAVQFYRGGRTAYVGVDSTWRWRFMRGDAYFGRFWGQAIRFLSSGRLLGTNKRLNVAADKTTYILGQKVIVHARSLDRFYQPVREEELAATLETPNFEERPLKLKAVPGSPGIFRGEFTPSSPGKYAITIKTGSGDDTTQSSSSFIVRMPALEYDNPGMNASTLRKMAAASGGKYFPLPEIVGISEELEKLREEYTSEEEHDIWDTPLLLVIFAALVVTEWAVRKRKMLA